VYRRWNLNKTHFKAEYSKLVIAYSKEVPTPLMQIYWQGFKGLSDADFTHIVDCAISTCEFFPTVAKLNEVMELNLELIPTESDVMNDMWSAIKNSGAYESPEFKYPVTNALAEELGWKNICNSTDSQVVDMVHFRYKGIANNYSNSVRTGKGFAVNKIKGIFEETGTPVKLQSGNTAYVQRDKNNDVGHVGKYLKGAKNRDS